MTMTTSPPAPVIPVIDISPFCDSDTNNLAQRSACAQQWHNAMATVGFAVIVGHGIPVETIEDMRASFRSFFQNRSLEYKQQYEYGPYGHPNGGYTSIGGEAVARSADGHGRLQAIDESGNNKESSPPKEAPADPVESFVCTAGNPADWGGKLPAQPPEVTAAAKAYYTELRRLLDCLHTLSEVALKLPEGYFDEYYKPQPQCYLVAKYYPAGEDDAAANQKHDNITTNETRLLYGAHTDYTGYTILKPDDGDHQVDTEGRTTGGLQVFVPSDSHHGNSQSSESSNDIDGVWHNVRLSPKELEQGALVVNLGDLWEDWTNGQWISAAHRVVAPNTRQLAARMSLPFFTGPRNDALIKTLPSCCNDCDENVKLAQPITAGEHLRRKLESTQAK